jgi:FKBP-type peptidyl-prolyl cis-trans isomerase SlyD
MEVATNTVVTIRYVMKNGRGEILEDTMDKPPVEYLHGSGNILPGLEKGLDGLPAGFSKLIKFTIDDNSQETYFINVKIDSIRAATPAEIERGKPELKHIDKGCGPACCC